MTEDATDEGGNWNCSLFVATKSWNKDEVTWNDAQAGVAWADTYAVKGAYSVPVLGGGDHNSTPVYLGPLPADSSWITVDVTSAVEYFVQNPDVNFGMIIKDALTQKGYFYASSKYADSTKRPKLTLSYESTGIIPVAKSGMTGVSIESLPGMFRMSFPHVGKYIAELHDAKGRMIATTSGIGGSAELSGFGKANGVAFLTLQFEGRSATRSVMMVH